MPEIPVPTIMNAVSITTFGGPEVLQAGLAPTPIPGQGEVLIAVHAAGVNRPDILQRRGAYPPPAGASPLPGLEVTGTIIAHGPSSPPEIPPIGTRVCALLAGGGYAQYATAPSEQIIPLPDDVDFISGAALPEALFTVYQNLILRGRMAPFESILIHGGTSGIGSMAIQVVRYLAHGQGGTIIVTCGTDNKCTRAKALGANIAVNYQHDDFVQAVARATNDRGVDIVLDMIGGDYLPRNLACLATGGRHISIATQGGSTATIDLRLIMRQNLTLTGGTLRPQPVAVKGAIRDAILRDVWPGVVAGAIRPIIHATFPLNDACSAHQTLESGTVIGKIVLVNTP